MRRKGEYTFSIVKNEIILGFFKVEEGTVYYPAINVLGSPERDEDGPNRDDFRSRIG